MQFDAHFEIQSNAEPFFAYRNNAQGMKDLGLPLLLGHAMPCPVIQIQISMLLQLVQLPSDYHAPLHHIRIMLGLRDFEACSICSRLACVDCQPLLCCRSYAGQKGIFAECSNDDNLYRNAPRIIA